MGRLPIVAVIGSGVDDHDDLAQPLGQWLAGQDVHLLTGGGSGVMEAVSRSFHSVPDRRGLVIGVLPGEAGRSPEGYPNPWVEIPIATHLPFSGEQGTEVRSRNHINVLSADAIIVLPGGAGTASEVDLAIKYRKPLAAFAIEPGDLSKLPPDVSVYQTIDEIKAFVTASLKTRAKL
ncbi:MAG: molybdenum cofactor carrier protein [Acidobacteriota bacterium]|nr:molybdenum cofactor carrier protein [Acidobacteriota bacterium]